MRRQISPDLLLATGLLLRLLLLELGERLKLADVHGHRNAL